MVCVLDPHLWRPEMALVLERLAAGTLQELIQLQLRAAPR
jgi:hypothetical protein